MGFEPTAFRMLKGFRMRNGCETATPCDPWHCSRLQRLFGMSMPCRQNNRCADSQVADFPRQMLTCVMRLPEVNSPMSINTQRHAHLHNQSPFFLTGCFPIERKQNTKSNNNNKQQRNNNKQQNITGPTCFPSAIPAGWSRAASRWRAPRHGSGDP